MVQRLVALVLASCLAVACSSSRVAVRNEMHPASGKCVVSATIDEWPNGYYSTAITIHNVATQPIALKPTMFRLEGTPPTSFVPAGRMPIFFGRAGYRMPDHVDPRGSVQGEVFFSIRGTKAPSGPVRLVVALPDGEHVFDFELLQ
jgi:hypothetical protein